MKPSQVTEKLGQHLLGTMYNSIKITDFNIIYEVADYLRISKVLGVYAKEYMPTEVFRIREIRSTNLTTYLVQDENKNVVLGGF